MFASSFPPVVCRIADDLFTLFVLVCIEFCHTHISYRSNMEDVLWEAGIACFSLAHEFTPVLMGSVLLVSLDFWVVFLFCLSSMCLVCQNVSVSIMAIQFSLTFIEYLRW